MGALGYGEVVQGPLIQRSLSGVTILQCMSLHCMDHAHGRQSTLAALYQVLSIR